MNQELKLSKELKILICADFLLRMMGIASFTLFIAAIYQITGKSSDIGYISVATVLPSLLVTMFAGSYTAKFSALGVLRWMTATRMALFGIASIFADYSFALLIAAGVQSLTHQISISAKMSLDAECVTDSIRRSYIGKKTMLANIAIVVGPALGGLMIGNLGAWPSLLIMAAISSVVFFLLMPLPSSKRNACKIDTTNVSAFASLRHLLQLPQTLAIVVMFCLVSVILEVQAPLMFPFVKEVYASGSEFTGILLGLAGLGGIFGAFLAQRFPDVFKEKSIPWLVVGDGLVFLIFTQLKDPIFASIIFTSLGMMGAVTLIIVEGSVQKNIQGEHRPFVFSVMQFAWGAGGASLGILAAFSSEIYGSKYVLAGAAIGEMALGVLGILLGLLYLNSKLSVKNPLIKTVE